MSEENLSTLDQRDNTIKNILIDSIQNNTPQPKAHDHKANRWWTKSLDQMRKETNRLRRKFQRSRSQNSLLQY